MVRDKYCWLPPFDWSIAYENEQWWDEVRDYYVGESWFVQALAQRHPDRRLFAYSEEADSFWAFTRLVGSTTGKARSSTGRCSSSRPATGGDNLGRHSFSPLWMGRRIDDTGDTVNMTVSSTTRRRAAEMRPFFCCAHGCKMCRFSWCNSTSHSTRPHLAAGSGALAAHGNHCRVGRTGCPERCLR